MSDMGATKNEHLFRCPEFECQRDPGGCDFKFALHHLFDLLHIQFFRQFLIHPGYSFFNECNLFIADLLKRDVCDTKHVLYIEIQQQGAVLEKFAAPSCLCIT